MTREENKHYLMSSTAYFNAYGEDNPDARYLNYYSHLTAAHPYLDRDALAHAKIDGNGPFYVGENPRSKALLVATRVAGDSRLGQKWNLRQRINNEPSNFDAALLWRVDRAGPKLLTLDVWPEGSHPQQQTSMQDVLARFRPRSFFSACCGRI